ncbi:MAG: diacylglycerol/lipid kinase family protein [Faecousia sp.]
MKKLLILMNPCSGKKKANRVLAEIIDILNRGSFDVTAYMTAARGDATTVAAERAAEFDVLLCIGGDGTFNEVISGLYSVGSKTPVAYIPAGSTNDFANSLKLSKDLLQAARDVVEGTPRPLDIGRFNDRYFSYIASFGAFTRASYATSQSLKNALGHFAYILSGVKEIASIRSKHLRLTLADGTVFEDDYIFGAISNSTSVAGLLTLAPDLVDMNDGLFEVLLIRKPKNPLELSDCVLALTTQDYNTPMLTMASSERVEIEAPEDMDWTLDGERADGAAHCTVENLRSAVNVITNPKS